MRRTRVNTILFSTELYSRYKLMYDVLLFGYTPIKLKREDCL